MRIFATYNGSKKLKTNLGLSATWVDVFDEIGNPIKGELISNAINENGLILRKGNRYSINCKNISNNVINSICSIKGVYKNKRCDIFRKALGTYYIINGKYNGLKIEDIFQPELYNYLIWLAKNSKNEATIKNCLDILEKFNSGKTLIPSN